MAASAWGSESIFLSAQHILLFLVEAGSEIFIVH